MMRFFYTLKFQIGLAIFCLILPLAGAIIGEMFMGEELRRACKSGFGTFMGMLGGTVARLLLSMVMIGWFVVQII